MTVKVADEGGSTDTATSHATVADAPLAATGGVTLAGVEGAKLDGTVASFTDANPAGGPADYTATIGWGDGSSSTGTVTANGSGGFTVAGSHTYAEEGPFDVTVTVTDKGGSTDTATSHARIADAALTASGVAGGLNVLDVQAFTGKVAHFTDADPAGAVSDYTATIGWGDGSSSAGTVTASGDGFDVAASHTYTGTGPYTISVHVAVGDRSATGSVTFWGGRSGRRPTRSRAVPLRRRSRASPARARRSAAHPGAPARVPARVRRRACRRTWA